VIYSYNRSQEDALFLIFILICNSRTCFGQTYCPSIIRSLDTVFTAIGICHTISVDCLLADNQHKYSYYDKYQLLLYERTTQLLPLVAYSKLPILVTSTSSFLQPSYTIRAAGYCLGNPTSKILH